MITIERQKMKIDWEKITNLKFWYIVAFFVVGYPCYYLMERDIELPLSVHYWLPFLIIIVGYIHVKFFHKIP